MNSPVLLVTKFKLYELHAVFVSRHAREVATTSVWPMAISKFQSPLAHVIDARRQAPALVASSFRPPSLIRPTYFQMAFSQFSEEVVEMILTPLLRQSQSDLLDLGSHDWDRDLDVQPSVLRVCKQWLRIGTAIFYETLIMDPSDELNAHAKLFKTNSAIAKFVKTQQPMDHRVQQEAFNGPSADVERSESIHRAIRTSHAEHHWLDGGGQQCG